MSSTPLAPTEMVVAELKPALESPKSSVPPLMLFVAVFAQWLPMIVMVPVPTLVNDPEPDTGPEKVVSEALPHVRIVAPFTSDKVPGPERDPIVWLAWSSKM